MGGNLKKWFDARKRKRNKNQEQYEGTIQIFLERDDNSRYQPGKADAKKNNDGVKVQTRVLTDYLSHLHDKFLSENPGLKLSCATFCRLRPRHILLTSLISGSSCLCTEHQNMTLKLRSLRREGVTVPLNPETFLKSTQPTVDGLENDLP